MPTNSNAALCVPHVPKQVDKQRLKRSFYASKPFAGEVDLPLNNRSREGNGRNKFTLLSISGCTTFKPGTRNMFGMNYQQVLKTAEHYKVFQSDRNSYQLKRSISDRMIDCWGNLKNRDILTTQYCANHYIKTLHGDDVDFEHGIGKPKNIPPQKEASPSTSANSQMFHSSVPRVSMPPRVAGHTGHIMGSRHIVGLGFNKIQMIRNKQYAKSINFENRVPLIDRTAMVPLVGF